MCLPKCYFDHKTLTTKVGNSIKGYEILSCVKIPTFTKIVKERECLGNGWYGGKIEERKVFDNYFVILKNNKPTGVLYNPLANMKCDILPLSYKYHSEVKDFLLSLNN